MPEPDGFRTLIAAASADLLKVLKAGVRDDPELRLVAACRHGRRAVDDAHRIAAEIAILEASLPGINGLDVGSRISTADNPALVFVVEDQDQVAAAFELMAADVLVRPFGAARLRQALSRSKAHALAARADPARIGREPEGGGLPVSSPYVDRLLVRDGDLSVALPVAAINWLESAGNYVQLHTRQRTFRLRGKIRDLDSILDPAVFTRIHRSRIVNMRRVAALRYEGRGAYVVTMKDGTSLRASRMLSQDVLRRFFVSDDSSPWE